MARYFFFLSTLLCCLFNNAQAQIVTPVHMDSLLQELQYGKPDSLQVKRLTELGEYFKQREPTRAGGYLDTAIRLARHLGWNKGIVGALITKGALLNEVGKSIEAINLYEEALSLAEKETLRPQQASILNNLGTSYATMTDLVKAMEYYMRSLKIAEESASISGIATALLNIGVTYYKQGDHKKSLVYKKRALKIYEHIKDWDKAAMTINGMANDYFNQGQLKTAENYYIKALKLYEKIHNRTGVAIGYSQIAILYEPDYPKIITYQLMAKKIFDEVNPGHYNAMVNLGSLGYSYLNMVTSGQYKNLPDSSHIPHDRTLLLAQAASFLRQAIAQAKTMGNKEFESFFIGNLAEVNEQEGDFKNAFYHFRTFYEQNDSLYSQEIKNKISRLENERALSLKDKEVELAKLRLKQQWMYGIGVLSLILGLSLFFLLKYRNRQLQLKNALMRQQAEQTEQRLTLQYKITESELKAIRSQLNPHFIFNVLNNIEAYIMEHDQRSASRLIQKFARLNRLILENSLQSLVPLSKEWAAMQLYTELECMRFNQQFSFKFEMDKNVNMDELMIPPMLIQPLLENAIHHGFKNPNDKDKSLLVRVTQEETHLLFIVEDNGIGFESPKKPAGKSIHKERSFGLASIRERLEMINQQYSHYEATLRIMDRTDFNEKGTLCLLTLPKIHMKDEQYAAVTVPS